MRLLALAPTLMLCASALAQQPTEDELRKAINAAQQAIAKEFKVSEEHVQVVGEPQVLPDHVSLHKKHPNNPSLPRGTPSGKPAIVIILDPGLDEMVCGYPKVLVQGDQVELLTDPLRLTDSERAPFTEEECRQVLIEIDHFMEIAFDYEKGPERFRDVLAEKAESNLTHDEGTPTLAKGDERHLLTLLLEASSYFPMLGLEEIDPPELKEGENATAPERAGKRDAKSIGAEWEREIEALKRPLHEIGAFEKNHLAAVGPRIKCVRTLIDKHPAEVGKEGGFGPVVTYHFQWGGPDLIFVSESGHMKLRAVGGD